MIHCYGVQLVRGQVAACMCTACEGEGKHQVQLLYSMHEGVAAMV